MHSFLKSLPGFLESPLDSNKKIGLSYLYFHVLEVAVIIALSIGIFALYVFYPLLASSVSDYVLSVQNPTFDVLDASLWLVFPLAFLEEILFRLKFVSNTTCFVLGNWLFWNITFYIGNLFWNEGIISEAVIQNWFNASVVSGFVAVGVWVLRPGVIRALRDLQNRYFKWYVGFSAVVFGLLHIFNYNYAAVAPWWVWTGLVVPQMFLGVVFTWVCLRRSFWHAGLFHAAYNLSLILVTRLENLTASMLAGNSSIWSLNALAALGLLGFWIFCIRALLIDLRTKPSA